VTNKLRKHVTALQPRFRGH